MCDWVDRRNNDAHIGDFSRVAAIPADNAKDFRAHSFCVLQGSHKIRADILFEIAATHREYEHKVLGAQAAHAQPSLKHCCPTFIVHPRREFRHIVGGRVGFDPRDLAEIVHGMGSIGGTASHTQDEQAPA